MFIDVGLGPHGYIFDIVFPDPRRSKACDFGLRSQVKSNGDPPTHRHRYQPMHCLMGNDGAQVENVQFIRYAVLSSMIQRICGFCDVLDVSGGRKDIREDQASSLHA